MSKRCPCHARHDLACGMAHAIQHAFGLKASRSRDLMLGASVQYPILSCTNYQERAILMKVNIEAQGI